MTDRAVPTDLDGRIRLRLTIIIDPLSVLVDTGAPTRPAESECVA
jgi:hypothetical protein